MNKLECVPDQATYALSDPDNRISTEGGLAEFYRRNLLNAPKIANVTWQCSRSMFELLFQSYRAFIASGGDPFLVDLTFDGMSPEERTAKFVKGSLSLQKVQGETYYAAAQLQVMPADYDVVNLSWVNDSGLQRIVLNPATGMYALTGQAATFRSTTTRFNVVNGSYVLLGQDVALSKISNDLVLTAAHGSYSLNGQNATLTYVPVGGEDVQLRSPDGDNEIRSPDGDNELRSGV